MRVAGALFCHDQKRAARRTDEIELNRVCGIWPAWLDPMARQGPMGLVVRTIGIVRATVKIGLANIVYNMKRAIRLTERAAFA